MLITKTIEIDMGHRVPNHKSRCRNIHGHRYKIEVGVDDKVITDSGSSSEGMVIDFGDLKKIMLSIIDKDYDHAFVMYEQDELQPIFQELVDLYHMRVMFVDFIPTAENLSKFWFNELKAPLKAVGIKIKYVRVWETPTSTAKYEE